MTPIAGLFAQGRWPAPPGPEAALFVVAGFAVAALFLVMLCRHVRRLSENGPTVSTVAAAWLRVGVAGGLLGAMGLLGPWPALAGVAGFVAGRVLLLRPVMRYMLPENDAGVSTPSEGDGE